MTRKLPHEADVLPQFPQEGFEEVCFRALGLIESNREYLAQRLKRYGACEAEAQSLEDIRAADLWLERTLGEMMDLLACLRGTAQPENTAFDLCALAQELAASAHAACAKRGVRLKKAGLLCGEETLCPVFTDEGMAMQLGLQLLSNALRACGRGGHITLSLRAEADAFVLTVTDDGCGLPDAQNEAAARENHRRFLGGAHGGLLLCREYCRLLGWEFSLGSAPAGGAEAAVRIPAGSEPLPTQSMELWQEDEPAQRRRALTMEQFWAGEASS